MNTEFRISWKNVFIFSFKWLNPCYLKKAAWSRPAVKTAVKNCEKTFPIYCSSLTGQTPSRNPMWPPREVTIIATCFDSLTSVKGIAKKENSFPSWINYNSTFIFQKCNLAGNYLLVVEMDHRLRSGRVKEPRYCVIYRVGLLSRNNPLRLWNQIVSM